MSDIKPEHYVLSDLHIGHEKILEICRPWFKSIQEHDDYIINEIKQLGPSDYLWILGDVAFTKEGLRRLNEAPCHKSLIAGNHDNFSSAQYFEVFNKIKGCAQCTYGEEKILFTHIPMHPDQSRWAYNIHGHLHSYHVDDDRYINVSCEPMDFKPKRIKDILDDKKAAQQ